MAQKEKTCPKCAAKVSRWDTVCIECGSPLVADEQIDYDTAVTAGVVVGQTVGGRRRAWPSRERVPKKLD